MTEGFLPSLALVSLIEKSRAWLMSRDVPRSFFLYAFPQPVTNDLSAAG